MEKMEEIKAIRVEMKEIYDTHSVLFQGLKGVYIELQPQVNKKMV